MSDTALPPIVAAGTVAGLAGRLAAVTHLQRLPRHRRGLRPGRLRALALVLGDELGGLEAA